MTDRTTINERQAIALLELFQNQMATPGVVRGEWRAQYREMFIPMAQTIVNLYRENRRLQED